MVGFNAATFNDVIQILTRSLISVSLQEGGLTNDALPTYRPLSYSRHCTTLQCASGCIFIHEALCLILAIIQTRGLIFKLLHLSNVTPEVLNQVYDM
jgi:hypothetical protein